MDMKQYKRIEINIDPDISLIGNLVVPSVMHSYSMCVEYVKDWILDKIYKMYGKSYFAPESIYVDGKHMFEDFIRIGDLEKLRKKLPSIAIIPKIDDTYNKDNSYLKVLGIDRYITKGPRHEGFFNDFDNNLHLTAEMKTIQVEYNITLRLATRAQQLDMLEYLKLASKVGWTTGEYKDLDFILPYNLMIQIAKDAKFEVKDNKVVNQMMFLRYLNSKCDMPILYKMRGITGKQEYFLRLKECYIHMRHNSIDADEGERTGQTSTNFNISLNLLCTFPCPWFYVYYREYKLDDNFIEIEDDRTTSPVYAIKLTKFPDKDEHNWDLAMSAEIEERDHTKTFTLDLNELFRSDSDYNDILTIIQWCKDMYISPEIFLNFKLFSMGDSVGVEVNWTDMTLKALRDIEGDITNIAIYVNYQFLNEQLSVIENYKDQRIR